MQAIKLVVGVTPTCWRPPYGDVDDRIRTIANGLGLRTILWKYDSNDWEYGSGGTTKEQVDTNYQDFINKASNGSFSSAGAIILTHELNNFTMQEAMNYYERLEDAFQHIVPVAVALNKTQPYAETNYTMPTFEQYISGQTTVAPGSGNADSEAPRAGGPTVAGSSQSPQSTTTSGAGMMLPWSDVTRLIAATIGGILLC